MNWKVTGALGALFLVLCIALYVSVQQTGSMRAERDTAVGALNQAVEAQKRVDSIQGSARVEKRSKALESSKHQEKLQKGLEANKEWGSTLTPPEVQEALLGALEGLQ